MTHLSAERDALRESVVDRRLRRDPRATLLLAVMLAGVVLALLWAVAAVLCASRGLDMTDESFYLLSYRWWNVNYDNFTGAQYFYGPIFQLLDHNIAGLRTVKVVMLLLSHAALGWAFMRWLRQQRPDAPSTRWWESAGTAVIVACAGIVYSWLPLSPGYNDLTLTCAAFAAAAALRIARDLRAGSPPPWWAPFALGSVAVMMMLVKWSSSLVTLTVIAATIAVVSLTARQGWRGFLRMVGLAGAGALGILAVLNFLLVPLADLLPPMLEVNSLVGASSNSPVVLVGRYWDGAVLLLQDIVQQHGPLLVVAVLLPFLRGHRRLEVGLAVVTLIFSALQVLRHHGLVAGSPNLPSVTVTIFAPLLAVGLTALTCSVIAQLRTHREARRVTAAREAAGRRAVMAMLFILPIAQAAGTGNPVHYLAMTGLGIWMAAAIAILTGLSPSAHGVRTFVAGALALLTVATSLIAFDGIWNRPYRTTGHDASTAVAAGVPALSSVRLDPVVARQDAATYALLKRYVEPPGRAMMAFDGLSGLVLMLNGRPVGEAWYAGGLPSRPVAGIHRACDHGEPWWGARKPLVFFNRPVAQRERRALRSCHLSLRDDYDVVHAMGLTIYLPKDEAVDK